MEMDDKERELYLNWLNKSREVYDRKKRLEEPLNLNLNDIKTRVGDIVEDSSSNLKHYIDSFGKYPNTKTYRDPRTGKIDPDTVIWTQPIFGKERVFSGESWHNEAMPETEVEKLYGDLLEYQSKKRNEKLEPESVVFPNQQNNNQEQNDSNKKSYWDKLSGLLKP